MPASNHDRLIITSFFEHLLRYHWGIPSIVSQIVVILMNRLSKPVMNQLTDFVKSHCSFLALRFTLTSLVLHVSITEVIVYYPLLINKWTN